ncbi:MAG: hypothetical protein ACI9N9_000289 [Enterobacterales bacterium]|jgi:hypothetical protein
MPRLLINGFPSSTRACFQIRINASAKGSGSQLKMLFDKTVLPDDGIYELPLEKRYVGTMIRLEVKIPGYELIDKNIKLSSNIGYSTLFLTKQLEPELSLITDCYGSTTNWQEFDSKIIYKDAKLQFQVMITELRKQERNLLLGTLIIVLLFSAVLYALIGSIGLIILIVFAFYYHEKNKLNTWSDVSK